MYAFIQFVINRKLHRVITTLAWPKGLREFITLDKSNLVKANFNFQLCIS